jgi:very-short-patch-repair endonuclease
VVGGGEAIGRKGGVGDSACCCDELCHNVPPPLAGEGQGGGRQLQSAMMVDVPKAPAWQVSTKQRTRARRLRRDMTDAERIIWNAIRAHRMHGMSFRRQTPIGPFIVDFVCHAALLRRNRWRAAFGAREHEARCTTRNIPEIHNYEVMTNREGVLETIAAAVMHAPSPPLPRKRGREQAVPVAWPGLIES